MAEQSPNTDTKEDAQRNYIRRCLPTLIDWTTMGATTLAIFAQRGVLSKDDESLLKSISNERDRIMEFYKIIQTRLNFFEVLREAMTATSQTAVLELLNEINSEDNADSCGGEQTPYRPKKYIKLPNRLERFLDPANLSLLCIVPTIDFAITLENIKENMKGHCYIYNSVDDLRSYISTQTRDNPSNQCHVGTVTKFETLQYIINDIADMNMSTAVGKIVLVTIQINEKLLRTSASLRGTFTICPDWMEWNDLSPVFKQYIRLRLKEKVKVNVNEEFDNVLYGYVLVHLINGGELKLFKDTIPEPLPYYIHRTIVTRSVLSNDVFNLDRCTQHRYLVTGMNRSELSRLLNLVGGKTGSSREQLQSGSITAKFMTQDRPTHFERICEHLQGTGESIHLLQRDPDGRLRWQKTIGQMDGVQQFLDKVQVELSEQEFFDNLELMSDPSLPICISDSPGMGKSTLLEQVGRKLGKLYPTREVFFLNIVQFIHQINEIGMEGKDSVMKSLQNLICENDLAKSVLHVKLMSNNISIELLLDGFDELEEPNYHVASYTIQNITNSFKSIRLWITSRPHFLEKLENTLKTLGYKIAPFSEEDQIQFLMEYWSRNRDPLTFDREKLRNISQKCMKKIKQGLNSPTAKDIAGIPLQCRLIGEAYEQEAMEYSELGPHSTTGRILEIRSIAQLFEKAIDNRFKKYEDINDQPYKLTKDEMMNMHARLSFEFLLPERFKKLHKLFKPVNKAELLKVGVVEASSVLGPPRFIHHTFAEYFIAWGLVSKLKLKVHWFKKYVFNPSFFSDQIIRDEWTSLLFDDLLFCVETAKVPLDLDPPGELEDFKSYEFYHHTIVYFLNDLLTEDLQIIYRRFNNHFRRPRYALKVMKKLASACVSKDFLNIFAFLCELNTLERQEWEIDVFSEKFLILAIQDASLKFVERIMSNFKKYRGFNLQTQRRILHAAVTRGNFSIMEFVLNAQQLHSLVGSMDMLLHECIMKSRSNSEREIAQRILVCETLVNYNKSLLKDKNQAGRTPLLQPDIHVQLMIKLIELGADVMARNELGDTILHMDINPEGRLSNQDYSFLIMHLPEDKLRKLVRVMGGNGDTPLVRLLKLADPSSHVLLKFFNAGFNFNCIGKDKLPILAIAIQCGRDAETVKSLIDLGANMEWKISGKSLLHIAVESGNLAALPVLLDQKTEDGKFIIDVNTEDDDGLTLFDYVVQGTDLHNRFETGKIIVDRGGKLKETHPMKQMSQLHAYAERRNYDSVRLLLYAGAEVNSVDEMGNTPLHLGIRDPDITKLLLDNGANPNLANNNGDKPFHIALLNTRFDWDTYILLKSKTELVWTNSLATTALKYILGCANFLDPDELYLLIQECLDNGGNVNCQKEDDENTALHFAVDKQDESLVRFLVQNGANLDLKNRLQQTPLHRAALHSNKEESLEISKYLLECGADPDLADNRGRRNLDVIVSETKGPPSSQNQSNVIESEYETQFPVIDPALLWEAQGHFQETIAVGLERTNKGQKKGLVDYSLDDYVAYGVAVCPAKPNGLFSFPSYLSTKSGRNDVVVGSKGCSISDVVKILESAAMSDNAFLSTWSNLARELEMPPSKIRELHSMGSRLSLVDLVEEIIDDWVTRNSAEATVDKLIHVLDNNGMEGCAISLLSMKHREY